MDDHLEEAMSMRWKPRSQLRRAREPWAAAHAGRAIGIAVTRRSFSTGKLRLTEGDMVTVHDSDSPKEGWCLVQNAGALGMVPETLLELRVTNDPGHATAQRLHNLQALCKSKGGADHVFACEQRLLLLPDKSASLLALNEPAITPHNSSEEDDLGRSVGRSCGA